MEQKVGRGGDRWRRWRGEEKEKVEAVAVKVQDIWVKGPEKTVRACIQEEVSKQEVRCLSGSRRQEMRSADCSHQVFISFLLFNTFKHQVVTLFCLFFNKETFHCLFQPDVHSFLSASS